MFTADLLERAAKTFVQAFLVAFLGSLLASVTPGVAFSPAWWQAAALAALAAGASAALSAVTSLLSKPFGSKASASILAVPAIDVNSTVLSTTALEPIQGYVGRTNTPAESVQAALNAGVSLDRGDLEQMGVLPYRDPSATHSAAGASDTSGLVTLEQQGLADEPHAPGFPRNANAAPASP